LFQFFYLCKVKPGVVIFPGSNCDQDLIDVLETLGSQPVAKLWHRDTDLQGCTHIFIPGGFSYGDYLRSGAIAHLSPIMGSVIQHANKGGFVMGICNGFQILCETRLLPGALLRNTNMRFSCKNVFLTPSNTKTAITRGMDHSDVLEVPIAHGEGRFYCDAETLQQIESNGQVVFRYCDADGNTTTDSNPNGSIDNIAGIANSTFNVFGMMPHPERCASPHLFNEDGRKIFEAMLGLNVAS
jgi:phosphoribosylformylglycinamidine synthase I